MSKIIYCDGSSLGNPGPGGWAVVAIDTEKKLVWEMGGAQKIATNNQMELQACLHALKLILKSESKVFELKLDSKYVIQGVTEWSKGWIKNGWKNAQKKEVVNKEIWQNILHEKKKIEEKNIKLKWTHVYGHTGEEWNERCDEIAKSFASSSKIILRTGSHYD